MTILQALDRYYDRMAARNEVEAPGWSREKFGWSIILSADGDPIDVQDLHDRSAKKAVPKHYEVPKPVKRTAGILPNFLWDKTSYVLGRTAGEGKRTAQEHQAFRDQHLDRLAGASDEGLVALRRFLERWRPELFNAPLFPAEMLASNIMFRLEGDRDDEGRPRYIHQRPAAKALVEASEVDAEVPRGFCLISGREEPVERLHPAIKGVQGAQSSGASLVSFNLDAFQSYGKEQGYNAPTSQSAAFRYGAALNRMLDRNSRNRVSRPIGDATVVFWADASGVGEAAAQAAEDAFDAWFETPINDEDEARKIGQQLEAVAHGRPLADVDPRLKEGTRFHVLGLSPNAARLSVRYWLDDDFRTFAERLAEHYAHLRIEPQPWRTPPSVSQLLVRTTALQQKFENIPPLLAGEVMRAILSGAPYPRSLLAAAIIRLRAGDDPLSGWHAAAIRAVLTRAHKHGLEREDVPVSLNREEPSQAYQLGRLFAVLETAQRMALGRLNATIRDRYFGAASATPASVFPLLLRGGQNHLGKLRKEGKGSWLEREIEAILAMLPARITRSLKLEDQGRFAIGYYHQRKAQFEKPEVAAEINAAEDTISEGEEDNG
jgi:CRISPR-associated protein Csd1